MTHDDPHSRSADPVHDGRAVEAQYVRQGRGGGRVLLVLVVSFILVSVLLMGMWLVSQGGFAKQNVSDGHEAFDADRPAASAAPAAARPTAPGEPAPASP